MLFLRTPIFPLSLLARRRPPDSFRISAQRLFKRISSLSTPVFGKRFAVSAQSPPQNLCRIRFACQQLSVSAAPKDGPRRSASRGFRRIDPKGFKTRGKTTGRQGLLFFVSRQAKPGRGICMTAEFRYPCGGFQPRLFHGTRKSSPRGNGLRRVAFSGRCVGDLCGFGGKRRR